MKRAKKEPSQWFCPSCLASAADREDFLSQEGQLKRKKPAQKKKEAEQPKKKEGKHGPCPYCKGATKKMDYGNYTKHLLEQHHVDMDMATMPAPPAGMVASKPSIDMQKGRRMSKHVK